MEESPSQGYRRARPDSSSSRDTRMTPSSSNSSSAHLPPRSNTGVRAGSGASLLQERLRERKVESARQGRRRSDASAERGVQSSPVKANMMREERRPSSSGVSGKGMGVKQIEEQVSTLHKQNFDLKLELYHRRQRQEALEARLEAAEKEIGQQRELQEVNEQLLAELEKRDQAVEEAVGIIVNLEDKVERLMQDREAVKSFDSHYDTGYFRESYDPSSKPQPLDTKAIVRMPSFLSEQSDGAEALRSLYMPQNHYSDVTLPKLSEEAGSDVPDSPRLSVLSKSSFLSVYGDKGLSPGPAEDEEPRRHRKFSSVEKWIDERPANTTPQKPARVDGIHKNGFLSINDVLESPLQRLEKLKHTLEKHNTSLVTTRLPEPSRAEEKRKSRELLRRGFTDKASFEHHLPPTPDTISTSTLRSYQKSTDTLNQQADGQILSSTSTFPVPNPSFNAYQSTVSMRPRSAGETVTSRREGHGWDTETGEDVTETGSLSSTASASAYTQRPQRIRAPPDMFSFNSLEQDSYWGRDMMFNNDVRPTARYDVRRSSVADHDANTLVRYNDENPLSPIDTSPRPNLPDRRSSLSATAKLRKPNLGTTASSPISKDQSAKKSRLAMPRLFTRTDPTPTPNAQRPKANRSNSYFDGGAAYEDEEARATPPPIKRNRTAIPAYRPSSAGQDVARARRGSAFGYDGPADDVNSNKRSVDFGNTAAEENRDGGRSGGARKWLGLGRTGSLRRT